MNRIAIVGCGGSGKSLLARQLAAALDLPLTHLDAIYYDQNWNPLPQEEFAARQEKLRQTCPRVLGWTAGWSGLSSETGAP